MTAQRMRRWAAATFIAALLVLGLVLMSTGAAGMFLIFGQLLTIFLGIVAVALMVISLFFPHEIE